MARRDVKRPRKLRREALVFAHLERISKDLFLRHPDIVRQLIGRNTGIYALYRKNKLYYVGLATALRNRLKAHGKNKLGWDRFSIYLTVKDQHLREIEALLLRIARPPEAKQTGRLAQSKDLRREVSRAIRLKNLDEVSSLLGKAKKQKLSQTKIKGDPELVRFLPNGARLRANHNGNIYRARARRDGQVRFNGKIYSSLSLAGKAAIGRAVNGWGFWKIERSKGNWVRLTKVRKAGTQVYR